MERAKSFTLFSLMTGLLVLSAMFAPLSKSQNSMVKINGYPTGWSSEINLSNNASTFDVYHEIASEGENIHIVWVHDLDVYYKISTDGGNTWSSTKSIYQSNFLALYPDIAVSNQNVHMVVSDYEGWNGIYYRNSTDNGNSWNTIKRISSDGVDAGNPSIFVNNSNVHILWHDFRIGANGQVFYRRSLDGGITWDDGQGVDQDRQVSFSPSNIGGVNMAGDGSNISVVWYDERDGDWEIYWMISKDNGFTWEDGLGTPNVGRKISNSVDASTEPSIAINGSNIHIVWLEEQWPGPVYRIYYRNSTNNGFTWNPTQLLSGPNTASFATNIDVRGDYVWVMWNDNRDGSHEVFFKNSTDGGITWGVDTRLTEMDGSTSGAPRIALNDSTVHVIWGDGRNGNDDVYYKRSPDFPPDPTFTISFDEGWNLISIPLIQSDESIDTVLENITGKWDIIQTYDPLSPEPWKSYNIYRPDSLNDFDTLNHKVGFWINITEPGGVNLTVSGTIPASTSINLYAGCWNLVGYPSLTNETVANALFGTTADMVLVGDTSEPYHIKEVGPAYVMKPGEGYWVHAVADAVWVVDW